MRIHERARFRTFVLFIAPLGLVGCAQASSGAGDTPSRVQVDHDGGSAADTGAALATEAGGPEGGATHVSPTVDASGGAPESGSVVKDSAPGAVDAKTTSGGQYSAVPLSCPDGTSYNANVAVGGQMFLMDLDTGSTTVAVAGSTCTSCSSAGVSPLYNPGTGALDKHNTAESEYADGSGWSGEIYEDTVALGDGTPSVSLELVSMTTQDGFFQDDSYQGILGLGSVYNELPGTDAYIATARAAGMSSILGFELCASSGTMWLGGYDPSAANTAVQYTPMLAINENNPFYSINVDKLTVGTTDLPYSAADFQEPIVDTGTTLFYLPTPVFTALLAAINASTGVTSLFASGQFTNSQQESCLTSASATPADVNSQLPSLTFTLPSMSGGADWTLTTAPLDSYLFDAGGGQYCLAAGDGGTQGGATFGDTFLQGFVSVIDLVNKRVGFAPDGGCAAKGDAPMIHHAHSRPHHPRRHGAATPRR